MVWQCAAIDHGIAIFPFGKIGPCCQISADYLKPIDRIYDPDRFQDLHTETPPPACHKCQDHEARGITSYRQRFNQRKSSRPGLQFVDLRNTNLCNFKCRYCGPHFSSQWSNELVGVAEPTHTAIEPYFDTLFTDATQWLYNTGGEPLINHEHWGLVQRLVDLGLSGNIDLMYNSNLSTLTFKNLDIFDIWKNFRSVTLQVSIDAVGKPMEYIRSGAQWSKIEANLQRCLEYRPEIQITLAPVISILNVWFLPALYDYAQSRQLIVEPIILSGPDYLSLDVMPDACKTQAIKCVDAVRFHLDPAVHDKLISLINHNQNQCLFLHTMSHIMYLDQTRREKLMDLLPFAAVARDTIVNNHEYR